MHPGAILTDRAVQRAQAANPSGSHPRRRHQCVLHGAAERRGRTGCAWPGESSTPQRRPAARGKGWPTGRDHRPCPLCKVVRAGCQLVPDLVLSQRARDEADEPHIRPVPSCDRVEISIIIRWQPRRLTSTLTSFLKAVRPYVSSTGSLRRGGAPGSRPVRKGLFSADTFRADNPGEKATPSKQMLSGA
jgi:hypothetical protein